MSTTTSPRTSSGETYEVVKWYTRARRFPQLIGKTPDGATIWGGPYTYTQVIAGVAFVVIGSKTTWLWGHFGLIGNALILLGGAYGLVVLMGRLPIGSRNPIAVGAGAVRAFSSPVQGHLGGAPVRIRRPRPVRSRLVVNHDAPSLAEIQARQANPTPPRPARSRHRLPRPRWSRPKPTQQPPVASAATATATRLRPVPATAPRSSASPALSGVQRLLASAGVSQED